MARPKGNVEPELRAVEALLPEELRDVGDIQTAIPRIAKDRGLVSQIQDRVKAIPTHHRLVLQDARSWRDFEPESIHLVLTSPPYWTLKRYRPSEGQLGHIQDYEEFLSQLDRVWRNCFDALLPGGRLVCVVGDVCLSRRKNNGRHTVVPLHGSIEEHCRRLGFDNLATVIWHKIANAQYEARGAGGILGKPYEPNAVIKNDIEFVLMERKPGGYRKPSAATRLLSIIPAECHREWFQQIWTGIGGASTRNHPAPFPVALAERIIRMFSFVGDTVLDPFAGTGTTAVAASRCGRNSISLEVDPSYLRLAERRMDRETRSLFGHATLDVLKWEGKRR